MAICIIIGHGKSKSGGYDSGAVNGSYHEFKIAKEIGRYAAEHYKATYTETAELMNYNGSLYLTERIKEANRKDYDFIAEIHLNAGGGTGSEVFYSKTSVNGKRIAAEVSKSISKALGIINRGAKTKINSSGGDYFGIIRQTNAEALLVECCFIDTADLNKIKTPEAQKKCGIAIADAIAAARGIKKRSAASNFLKCDSKATSIVDALGSIGANSSFGYRKKIAEANSIKGYTGTAQQNIKLLSLLKQGKLIKP